MKIPFTNIEFNPFHLLVHYLAFFGARNGAESACLPPTGNYLGSCDNLSMTPYVSSDPFAPSMCKFTASCTTIFKGLPPQANEVYLPEDYELNELTNFNGTLTYHQKPLATASKTQRGSCDKPRGSYRETCKTDASDYESTDSNLDMTPLCEARSNCQTLTGQAKSNLVYFNLHNPKGSVQRLENCAGQLVVAPEQNDQRCKGKKANEIERLAKEEGLPVIRC